MLKKALATSKELAHPLKARAEMKSFLTKNSQLELKRQLRRKKN
jgi:hypothetical protein